MTNEQIVPKFRSRNAEVPDKAQPLGIGAWAFTGHWSLRHWSFPRSLSSAFTLIELILVMALLSIVLAVSAPALSGFFRGRSVDAAARRLVSLIRYGQSRAVSEGVPIILWIDARRGTYGLEQEPGYVDVDPKAVRFELPKDLRIEVTDLPVIRSAQAGPGLQAAQNPSVPRLRFQPERPPRPHRRKPPNPFA